MKKLTKEEFINRSIEVHKNKYDYSLVEYLDSKTKVKIIFNGNIYEQTPNKHLQGKCPEKRINILKTADNFIESANKLHNNKYDYSLIDYKGCYSLLKIICPLHGIFNQRADSHLNGKGCIKCGIEKNSNICRIKITDFIERSLYIHGDIYDYSKVKLLTQNKKVTIICKKHGEFIQRPSKHIRGQGCPHCNESKGERDICLILDRQNIKYIRQYVFQNCFYKRKLKYDFYLPDYNTCIEYDGIQHHKPIDIFGGEEEFNMTKKRDKIKNIFCCENKINLFRINYSDNLIEKIKTILCQVKDK